VRRRSPTSSLRHTPAPRSLRGGLGAFVLACGLLLGLPPFVARAAPVAPVVFADPEFGACVAAALGLRPGSPLTTAQVAGLVTVSCTDYSPAALDGAEFLIGANEIDLGYSSTVTDLTPLAGLSGLKVLAAPYASVADVTPLRGLRGLTRLDLAGDPITSLDPLSGLTALTYLDVSGATWHSLEPLRRLTALQQLFVEQPGAVDISALSALTALRVLQLTVPDVQSVTPLRGLTRLTSLYLHANADDLSPVAPLTQLETLSLNSPGSGTAALAGKSHLTTLMVFRVTLPDFDPLAGSPGITDLVSSGSGARDVEALSGLTHLSSVTVDHVAADFRPLSRLPELTSLWVSESHLGDLAQFDGFASLRTLSLPSNGLASLRHFTPPANLTSLDLSRNHLVDVSRVPCTLNLTALNQAVHGGTAQVGQPVRLPLAAAAGQPVTVSPSPAEAWTVNGTTVTYTRSGRFAVPFSATSGPPCGRVLFTGKVIQIARGSGPIRP
jgi:Leucine-rich repeat (LRR) protein